MGVVRRIVHAVVIVLTLIVGAAAAAVIASQTVWFKNLLRGYIVREASQYLDGAVSIERLGGNLFFGIEMENVAVSIDGEPIVVVKGLGLDYNVFDLIARGLTVENIRFDKPVIYLRRQGDTWSLSRLVKKQDTEADRSGPGRPVSIEDIGISDGVVVVEPPAGTSGIEIPKRFDHLDAQLSFKYEPVRYSIEITHVSLRGSEPPIALNTLSGGVAVKDDAVFVQKLALRTSETSLSIDGAVREYLTNPSFNLRIASDKWSIPEIAQLVPSLAGIKLQPAFDVELDGPLDRLGIEMNVRSSAGHLTGKLLADIVTPGQSLEGQLSVSHLDLAPILNGATPRSDISADARLNVRGAAFSDLPTLRGEATLAAPKIAAAGYVVGPAKLSTRIQGRQMDVDLKAVAYGARAAASGRVTLPGSARNGKTRTSTQSIAFDLQGQLRAVDLRNLPRDLNVPAAATDLNADYRVSGTVAQRLGGQGSSPGGASVSRVQEITPDITADLTFRPSTVANARIAGGSTAGVAISGDAIAYKTDATVAGLDLQVIGGQFGVPALADGRYKSGINGHIVASGRGTKPVEMDLSARGTLTDTSVMGGQVPNLAFDATLASDTAHVKANGTFADVDLSTLSGKDAVKGKISGQLSIDAAVDHVSAGVTADAIRTSAKVDLDPSTIGGLEISHAAVDGDYHGATGDIRALEIVGRDLNVRASGTLALNDDGQSNLRVHADTSSLETIGKLIDQPLTGIAKVDATVTGNRRTLQAVGNFMGDRIEYHGNGALTASTDFTANVRNLDAGTADVSATTHATFVTVAGRNINELTAKTTYAQQQVEFDAMARQPQRSLSAAGSAVLHTDHQEVHLRSLGFQSQAVLWQTAADAQPTIQYGDEVITVKDFRLVSGTQQMSAEGTVGRPGDAIQVTLKDLDVASVDALLLRPTQLSGRLNASAQVTGSRSDPVVDATFAIDQGGFRQFRYDTFGGTLRYAGKGLDVDARLQQNPTNWLTAKGYAPVSIDARRNQYDLHINSSSIDVGLVQGFTTALTGVAGTLQAQIDVTGSADDPHPGGAVTIQRARFTVVPSGVTYTDLDGRISLLSDRVHIDQIRVLDNHRSPLTISGDLPIQERESGALSIAIKANDFKVVDNQLGNVRINTDLRIAGQLNAPRVEGELGVTTGTVNLDPILAQVGTSAYAMKETEFVTAAGSERWPATGGGISDALYAYVHLTVPNDLVMKANDLRVPGSPIGLGALNVTLGGDVVVHKAPYDQPRLYGAVNTVRGNYDFQGRRFEILRDGTVKFEGLDEMDPSLDLRTQRIIQAVTAMLNIRGTLRKPEITLSSTPPLEEADILSLIVFNQPINQIGEGQQTSLAATAQGMALGAAAGQLTRSIGSALNLDTFELNVTPESGGGPEVTIGEQIGQNLFIKVQQGVGDMSQTNFILEYELTNWLRFRTNVLQGSSAQAQLFRRIQGSGADLQFFFSY